MSGEHHERAHELLAAAQVEGLSAADQAWLDSHLDGCADCRVYAKPLCPFPEPYQDGHLIRPLAYRYDTPIPASFGLV